MLIKFPLKDNLRIGKGQTVNGFEMVDTKGECYPVKAAILKNNILITIPPGQNYKEVWYAMQPFTRANLTGGTGLPVSTFILPVN